MPDQVMSNFWWTELPWDTSLPKYFDFSLPVSLRHFSLTKEQTGESARFPRSNAVSGHIKHWIGKYFNPYPANVDNMASSYQC